MQSKSSCSHTIDQGNPLKHISKSEERFDEQYGNAPRKIFMRPPCEDESPRANVIYERLAVCEQAVFVMSNRSYEGLISRRLLALDRVLELQGHDSLRIEQVQLFCALLRAVLAKFVGTGNEHELSYSQKLESLLEISGREISSPSLTAFSIHASDLTELYETIGIT